MILKAADQAAISDVADSLKLIMQQILYHMSLAE